MWPAAKGWSTLPERPDGALATVTPPSEGPGPVAAEGHHTEHRRLLVGELVVRRVFYRSVVRVAWPFFLALYASVLAVGLAAWNVAAVLGWSPGDEDVDGGEVFWTALGAGVVVVPLAVAASLGLAALYNTVSEHTGGLQVAVVSPRRSRRRHLAG